MNTRMNLAFVKPASFSLTSVSAWSWALLAIAALFALLTLQHYGSVKTRLLASQERLQSVMALQPQAKVNIEEEAEAFKLPKQEISMIRKTVEQLGIPWDGLFETFESTQLKNVALLELSPSQQKEMVVIRGEASDLDAVFAYIRALEKAPVLDRVHLQNHYVEKTNPDQPVAFTLHAQWKVGSSS